MCTRRFRVVVIRRAASGKGKRSTITMLKCRLLEKIREQEVEVERQNNNIEARNNGVSGVDRSSMQPLRKGATLIQQVIGGGISPKGVCTRVRERGWWGGNNIKRK